ncbi:MAG: protein-L-isoaspartate O-methyltransferase [Chromatiales bacterium]|nr:protein-L-isoaspartate O-methyltransferase [Chromatiales bacterium]
MADMNIELARHNLIEQQIRPWDVLDDQVLETVMRCPREAFVAPGQRNLAFVDMELPIGHGEHMMHPKLEARMLQALQIKPDDRVLEVGTGSGYVTMMLAHLGDQVVSVEINEELAQGAMKRLTELGVENAQVKIGDGSCGWEAEQPYDAIAITGSLSSLPEPFKQQLQIGGRLFAIIGNGPVMEAQLITRTSANEWHEQVLFETSLTPLNHQCTVTQFHF